MNLFDKLMAWIWEHPLRGFFVLSAFSFLVAFLVAQFLGCATKPPKRFTNGDRTVIGPKNYYEVDEPDMAHPSVIGQN